MQGHGYMQIFNCLAKSSNEGGSNNDGKAGYEVECWEVKNVMILKRISLFSYCT